MHTDPELTDREMTNFSLLCGFFTMTSVVEAAYCAISGMIKCLCLQTDYEECFILDVYFFLLCSVQFFHGIKRTDTEDGVLCLKRAD